MNELENTSKFSLNEKKSLLRDLLVLNLEFAIECNMMIKKSV